MKYRCCDCKQEVHGEAKRCPYCGSDVGMIAIEQAKREINVAGTHVTNAQEILKHLRPDLSDEMRDIHEKLAVVLRKLFEPPRK